MTFLLASSQGTQRVLTRPKRQRLKLTTPPLASARANSLGPLSAKTFARDGVREASYTPSPLPLGVAASADPKSCFQQCQTNLPGQMNFLQHFETPPVPISWHRFDSRR